jgi:hypothetical protein
MKLDEIVTLTEMVADTQVQLHIADAATAQPQGGGSYNIAGFTHHYDSGAEQNVVIGFSAEREEGCEVHEITTKDGQEIPLDQISNMDDICVELMSVAGEAQASDEADRADFRRDQVRDDRLTGDM